MYNSSNDETLLYSGHGPWTDMLSQKTYLDVSISVCYPAFYTAIRKVQIQSQKNRTEPIAFYDNTNGYFTIPDVHNQMAEAPPNTVAQ